MSEAQPPVPQPPPGPAPYRYRSHAGCSCARCRCRSLTWPVLLIAIGLLKLLESTASMEGHRG